MSFVPVRISGWGVGTSMTQRVATQWVCGRRRDAEERRAILKSEPEAAPVYLKRPQRVVGPGHAHFLAVVIEALIERTVLLSMLRHETVTFTTEITVLQ